jgi:hypothetical protein
VVSFLITLAHFALILHRNKSNLAPYLALNSPKSLKQGCLQLVMQRHVRACARELLGASPLLLDAPLASRGWQRSQPHLVAAFGATADADMPHTRVLLPPTCWTSKEAGGKTGHAKLKWRRWFVCLRKANAAPPHQRGGVEARGKERRERERGAARLIARHSHPHRKHVLHLAAPHTPPHPIPRRAKHERGVDSGDGIVDDCLRPRQGTWRLP